MASVMQVASINEGWAHTMAGDREYEQCIKVDFFMILKLLGMLAFYFTFVT
jgi:hypothetical protein